MRSAALSFLALTATLRHRVSAQALSAAAVSEVTARLAQGAQKSWELGTRAESLLELDVPQFSVFSATPLPPPTSVPSNATSAIAPVFSIAHNVVKALNKSSTPQPLISDDGAAGDPPAIGVAVLLANWTGQGASDGLDYAAAAKSQLDYVLDVVPRTSDGAISHRAAQVQLWGVYIWFKLCPFLPYRRSDSVYMVPPFLAYYGVLSGNTTLISEAYNQIKLYRNYLRDTKAKNLWKHIVLGTDPSDGGNDEGHWSTGNAWAAAGMLRVLATMKNSPYSKSFSNQQKDLASWVKEIHSAMFSYVDSTNIFTNYADTPVNSNGMFYDTASTALLASTVYRASLLLNDHSHLPNAEKCRKALFASGSSASSQPTGRTSSSGSASITAPASSASATTAPLADLVHFTSDGWLSPVVNPHQFGVEGSESPEGQAFVLQMQASYSEWVAGGSIGANAARGTAVVGWVWLAGCVVVGGLLVFV